MAPLMHRCAFAETLLILHESSVSDYGIAQVGRNCPSLTSIDIGNCPNITDIGLRELAIGDATEFNPNLSDEGLLRFDSCDDCLALNVMRSNHEYG